MSQLIRANEHIKLNRGFGTQELNDVLEKALERETQFKTKKSFAPSGLGYSGACPRYWYYAFNGANFESTADALAIQNMDNGSAAGERIANLFDKAGILVSAELPVRNDDPPVFGYIDAIVDWKGKEVVVEVKTTRSATWNQRLLKNEVPSYQLIQLLMYMYLTDHDRGFFFTENKDTHEVFVLPVKMTDEYKEEVERVLDWMRVVKHNATHGELPKRAFTKSSMQCKGCAVKSTCWDGYQRGSVNGNDANPGTIELEVLTLPK